MKKSLFMMLLLGLTFSISLSATTNPDGSMIARTKVVKEKTINLQLLNLKQQETQVTLTDLYENEKFYGTVIRKHNGFVKQLNLKKLKDGNYLIKVKSGDETLQQVVRIRGNDIMFSRFSS